ncbi:MAG: pyridoxal phosphate-dependent aminotransferase family protein [bacterium]|nr:pyridoxal phosphate-dependent aminotransferase family protein [bacterium]
MTEKAQSFGRYLVRTGKDIKRRGDRYAAWRAERATGGDWFYEYTLTGPAGPSVSLQDAMGRSVSALNFNSQDYLSLTSHPDVRAAVLRAVHDFGLHSAGAPMLAGNTRVSRGLEADLASWMGLGAVATFPTGWSAGFGAIAGLCCERDEIFIDELAHDCLVAGARASGAKLTPFAHNDLANLKDCLDSSAPSGGRLVVTEALFSMNGDSPDLKGLVDLCARKQATLVLDVAHDLGAIGPRGLGEMELQGVLGQVDVVLGSFSKSFATTGGFVGSTHANLIDFLRCSAGSSRASNGASPLQSAAARAALHIIRSPQGGALRSRLAANGQLLRSALAGSKETASPFIIHPLEGLARGRELTGRLLDEGVIVSLIEYPAVPLQEPRWRFQLMATHTPDEIGRAADTVNRVVQQPRGSSSDSRRPELDYRTGRQSYSM